MLLELRIENLLVIERAELRFGAGLNAITGETGAGKTILAHSLDLLMGGRAKPNIVRPGAEEAWVEGTFAVPDGLLDDPELADLVERLPPGEQELVLGRRVGASGRTSAFVGGRSASAADLEALGGRLLAFFGQHQHRMLTLAGAQLEVLDRFAGVEHLRIREEYRRAHAEVVGLERELEGIAEREGARERDLDLLRFELAEIEEVEPGSEERDGLVAEREVLRNAWSLREASAGAAALMEGEGADELGAAPSLARAVEALEARGGVDVGLDELATRARSLSIELDDLASDLRAYAEGIEGQPGELERVEQRLEAIERLERKHGGSVEAVLEHAQHCRERIAELERTSERAEEASAMLEEASTRRAELAAALSAGRQEAAEQLERRVSEELAQLAMDGARLEVGLEPVEGGFATSGAETVELRIATNPGMPLSPLKEAASGGELSRVMLALSTLGTGGATPTIVFDEIDAGVGGATARSVGERLASLGELSQVICITHLPQVASRAASHFRIVKEVVDGAASTTVEDVEGDELVAEIVRMLGAQTSDGAAVEHARELLAA